MIINPRDRYLLTKQKEEINKKHSEELKKIKEEIIKKMIDEKIPMNKIIKITGLTEEQVQKIIT